MKEDCRTLGGCCQRDAWFRSKNITAIRAETPMIAGIIAFFKNSNKNNYRNYIKKKSEGKDKWFIWHNSWSIHDIRCKKKEEKKGTKTWNETLEE